MNPKNASASAPVPALDPKLAAAIAPTRHEPTGRTFCFVQGNDLFSATGLHVATDMEAAKAAITAKEAAAAGSAKAAS